MITGYIPEHTIPNEGLDDCKWMPYPINKTKANRVTYEGMVIIRKLKKKLKV